MKLFTLPRSMTSWWKIEIAKNLPTITDPSLKSINILKSIEVFLISVEIPFDFKDFEELRSRSLIKRKKTSGKTSFFPLNKFTIEIFN